MKLTDDQYNEMRRKLGQYFLDYSIRYTKNVVHRYSYYNDHPGVGKANSTPDVSEFMGILLNEPEH